MNCREKLLRGPVRIVMLEHNATLCVLITRLKSCRKPENPERERILLLRKSERATACMQSAVCLWFRIHSYKYFVLVLRLLRLLNTEHTQLIELRECCELFCIQNKPVDCCLSVLCGKCDWYIYIHLLCMHCVCIHSVCFGVYRY